MFPKNGCNSRAHWALPLILFFALAAAFSLPLLSKLYSSGSGDWDYFMFLYEVPAITLYEFKQFPLWNPYCGGGISLIGNPQAGHLSPIFILTSIFGVSAGLKLSVCLHTFFGLWGMWLLSGHLGICGPARLAPAFIFVFSTAWALHIAKGHIVWLPAALLPLFFLALLKGMRNKWWLLVAALAQSIMFYEGGTYVLGYSLVFVAIYVLVESAIRKSVRPMLAFLITSLLAAALSAPKLLPVLELLHTYPRPVGVDIAMPWDIWVFFFFDRFTGVERSFENGWWAFGSYLGIVVVTLYLFSFVLFRKHKALLLASLFLLLVSVGNFGLLSPWNILHELPFFSSFKVPTRVLIVANFTIALLVGHSLAHLTDTGHKHSKPVISLIVLVILCDLFSASYPTLKDASRPISTPYWNQLRVEGKIPASDLYDILPEQSSGIWQDLRSVHQPFKQISIPFSARNNHGAWSDQYLPLLQNTGVVDAYETIPFTRNAIAISDEAYNGEYHLAGNGSVSLLDWSPNRILFHIVNANKDRLVINQNFAHGWHSTSGTLTSFQGLLAVDLAPGEYDLELYYRPTSFVAGVGIFVITLIILLMMIGFKVFSSSRGNQKSSK